MIDRVVAVNALADPGCPETVLSQIAQHHPDLRQAVAAHPRAYPGLLEWLTRQGDPQVLAIVQARSRLTNSAVPAPQPISVDGGQPYGAVQPSAAPTPYVAAVPHPYSAPQPYPLPTGGPVIHQGGTPVDYAAYIAQGKATVTKAIDSITGFEGEAIVHFRDLFRDTFKKHTREDMDALMYSGTRAALQNRQWRLPWLYSRVFIVVFGAFCLLWVCMFVFFDTSGNVVPGVIFTGALVMPATIMVFFWEFDQSRAVSFFDVIRIFFIGGALSILLTFIVSAVTDLFHGSDSFGVVTAFIEATFIGFTEEVAKAVVVFLLVRKLSQCLISHGLLIGAVVGTGFAVFETMGYGTSAWLSDMYDGSQTLEYTLLIRGLLSVGAHVVWSAISGAAIMLAQRPGASHPDLKTMDWGKFVALFCVPFALHALWDFVAFVVDSEVVSYSLLAGLIAIAWVFIVRLINTGLRQYAGLLTQPG